MIKPGFKTRSTNKSRPAIQPVPKEAGKGHTRIINIGNRIRLSDPPGISDLAQACGVNEFKLKKGFKQLFGTTLFAYMRTYRLARAYHLLSSGEINVTEAALAVGYANPSAFASAFRKAYGINPIECRKPCHQVPGQL